MEHIEALGNSKDNVLYIFSVFFLFFFICHLVAQLLHHYFLKDFPVSF